MFDTYIVPQDSFDLRSKRIAIVPLSVPPDIEDPDSIITHFGGLIEGFLTRTGVDIVPAREYRAIWNRLTQEAGGFFDPYTGQRDEPKYRAGVAQLMKEVHERFEPDAFLYPELWVVEAPLSSGTAHWDGVSHDLDPAPFGIESVWAVTLAVVIEDSSGNELYVNGRGLEVLERVNTDSDEMEMIPRDELFRRSDLSEEAVAAVFAPLLSVFADSTAG